MASLMRCVAEWERDPLVLLIGVCPGYPYSDVERLGFALSVYTKGDDALANQIATELATLVWERRHDFSVTNTPAAEAVQLAMASTETPVILVDAADNIGGGTPGDGTVVLRELIRHKARNCVVTIADAEAVQACLQAGVGGTVRVLVGGKYDRHHGDPVEVEGYVRLISDGVYRHTGSYMTGMRVEMGRTAVLDADGVEIVVMERKALPFDAQQLISQGILPADRRAIVVKSAIAWRAAYGSIARKIITVDTPGLCSSNLTALPYRKKPSMFPLESVDYGE
jgi:microcystin degradation protein MlrC